MKLKFTHVFLAAAFTLGAVVSFSSCKDTENDLFVGVESEYAALKNKIKDLEQKLDDIEIPTIPTIPPAADLSGIRDSLGNVIDSIGAINDSIANINGAISGLNDSIANLQNRCNELDSIQTDLKDSLDSLKNQIDTLDQVYVDWDHYNTDQAYVKFRIDSLGLELDTLELRVDTLEMNVKILQEDIKKINKYLENIDMRVSGIQLQAAASIPFPMVNSPLNVRSLALFNYYGKVTDPSNNSLGVSGELWYDNEIRNLGTLYFSVNPLNIDLTDSKYSFSIINSKGEEAPVAALTPAKSDKLLTMGLSRAEDVVLWEVGVETTDPDAMAISFSDCKDQLIDIIKNLRNRNIGSLARVPELMEAAFLNNQSMPAYALKVTWAEADTAANSTAVIEKSAVSDFGLMANTFVPFSFNTLKDEHGPELPMLPEIDKLKDKFNTTVDEIGGKINIDLSGATLKIDKNMISIHINTVTQPSGEKVDLTLTGNDFETLINAIQQAVNGTDGFTQTMANDINAQITDVLDTIKTKASNAFDKVSNIYELLTKAYNKISDLIYTPNLALQPVAFIYNEDNGEVHRLSEFVTLPTQVDNSKFQICATTWTAELLAPVYLKQILVNGVEATVVDGSKRYYNLNLNTGINTIEYTAVDFHGYEAKKTYYVEVN